MMKMSEIREMTLVDIDKKIDELKTELFNFKIQKYTSGLEKTHEPKVVKKQIAKLLTQKSTLAK